MPFTINGCGTHYYFKRNVVTKQGVCPACRRTSVLTDYDIGHYLVAFYIPVLPLGRRMILGECQACSHHSSMPLRDWEAWRDRSIDQGLATLAADPTSGPAALELLAAYTTFNQTEEAEQLARAILGSHLEHYDVLLALGAWFQAHQHPAEAETCFRTIVRLDPQRPESRRIRLFQAMDEKAYGDVKSLALSLLEPPADRRLDAAFQAAQFFAERQKFDESFLLYEKMLAVAPELKQDKDFRRAARVAEQGVGRPATLVPAKRLGVWE